MRPARIITSLTFFLATMLVLAPPALAHDDGGQGWWGETTDKQITMVMFVLIGFFPLLILTLSLIQWRLEKRKHAREDAEVARAANADWRGGW
jgi:preprotein translocase subunit SecG